jgi:hypothetical protein
MLKGLGSVSRYSNGVRPGGPVFDLWRGQYFFFPPERICGPLSLDEGEAPSGAEVKNGGTIPPIIHVSSWRGA